MKTDKAPHVLNDKDMIINGKNILSAEDFAMLGEGHIAYLKEMSTDDLSKNFPDLPPMEPGISVWGLFTATGVPLILSDIRAKALEGAYDSELQTVTLQ